MTQGINNSEHAANHNPELGLVAYYQKDKDVTINGPINLSNLNVSVKNTSRDYSWDPLYKSLTAAFHVEGGSLTLGEGASTELKVMNVSHNIDYDTKSALDKNDSVASVYAITLNNTQIDGINKISAENITSNALGVEDNNIVGIELNNVQSQNKLDLDIKNIGNTNENAIDSNLKLANVRGIALTGENSQLQIGNITAQHLYSTRGGLEAVYVKDFNSSVDSITIKDVSFSHDSIYGSLLNRSGLHLVGASNQDFETNLTVNNNIEISNFSGLSQYSGDNVGVLIDGDKGNAKLSAKTILIKDFNIECTSNKNTSYYNGGIYIENNGKAKHILTADNILIENIASKNASYNINTFGIKLDGSTELTATESISIKNISSDSTVSSGYYNRALTSGIQVKGASSISAPSIEISGISSKAQAFGIVFANSAIKSNLETDNLYISDINGTHFSAGIADNYGSGKVTVNKNTIIKTDNLYAISVRNSDINFNGEQAVLNGDIQLDSSITGSQNERSSLNLTAKQAQITGGIQLLKGTNFTATLKSRLADDNSVLIIKNLRSQDKNNNPKIMPEEMVGISGYYSWTDLQTNEQLRYLDAINAGDGDNWVVKDGEGINDDLYALVDIDRSATIAVQDSTTYHANSNSNQEITFGAAIRANSNGKVLLDESSSDYTILGDIIAGTGALSLNKMEFSEEIWDRYVQQGYTTQGGEITLGGHKLTVVGDIFAANGGKITMEMNGDSYFEGQVDDYHELNVIKSGQVFHNSAFLGYGQNLETLILEAGNISITMNDDSEWTARGQSFLSSLSFGDGFKGLVDLSQDGASSITVANLSGNGRFKLNLDTSDAAKSDMLYVTDSMTGSHELIITGNVDVNEISEDDPLRFATVNTNSSSAATFKARSVDQGFFNNQYTIDTESFTKGDEDNAAYNGEDDGKGIYKPGNNMVEAVFDEDDSNIIITGVAKRTESDAGRTVINMSRANYANAVYMDTLNKRMGEARYAMGQDNGIWVRMRHDNIGKDDSFRSHNTMVEIGYDFRQALDESEFRYGAVLDYMNGQNEYHAVSGDGDLQRYGAWIYGTWLADDGQYADLVLKYGHLKNDFDVFAPYAGEHITGDYSNDVISASAEYGWKFANAAGWYVEPQAQLQYSYVTSADYTTSQGTKIDLDSIDSLIGRVGFRAGKDFAAENPITAYIRGDVLHEFLGDQDISARDTTGVFNETFENDDTWYSVGVGLSVMTTANTYFFIEGEQVFGADNEDTYSISGGFKHSF